MSGELVLVVDDEPVSRQVAFQIEDVEPETVELKCFHESFAAYRLRQQSAAEHRFIAVTRLERRRTLGVLAMAGLSLFFVAFEPYAHQFVAHHPWP